MKPLDSLNIVPEHQFGFHNRHSTTEQVHRVVEVINNTFECKKYCFAAFIDVTQALDKVWHPGLLYILKSKLDLSYCKILLLHLSNRYFSQAFHREAFSDLFYTKSSRPIYLLRQTLRCYLCWRYCGYDYKYSATICNP